MMLRFGLCCYMVIFGAPTIGGFVVVSQILKAYGICKGLRLINLPSVLCFVLSNVN